MNNFEKFFGILKAWKDGLVSLYRFTFTENKNATDALKIYSGTVMPTGLIFGRNVYRDPLGKKLLDEDICYLETKLSDFDYLKSLPEGSLGKEYYIFWSNNIEKNSSMDYQKIRKQFTNRKDRWRRGPVTDYKPVLRFFDQIAYQHDLMHTLLGYGISVNGEIGVHGALYKHWKIPAVKLIFWSSILAETYRKKNLHSIRIAIESRKIGKNINRNLFIVDWARYLPIQISDIRKEFNIEENIYYKKVEGSN